MIVDDRQFTAAELEPDLLVAAANLREAIASLARSATGGHLDYVHDAAALVERAVRIRQQWAKAYIEACEREAEVIS